MHPTYLRNIARCHQNLGNPDKAISSFREYLRKAPDLSPAQRKEIEGYIAEMEQLKQSQGRQPATPPPAAAPPAETSPALVGPATVTATSTRDEDGPFYTRVWFWGVVAGVVAAGRRHRVPAHARRHRAHRRQPGRPRRDGQDAVSRPAHIRWLVVAIALASACAKDKSTALDVKLMTVTGDVDQLSIDAISVEPRLWT
jgi:hypothetical protein